MLELIDCHVPASGLREEGAGGNREYVDLRDQKWSTVKACIGYERSLIRLLREGGDEQIIRARYVFRTFVDSSNEPEIGDDEIENAAFDSQFELGDAGILFSTIDAGCVSAVAALSALTCPTLYSCNGGAFGTRHHSGSPVIAFYARPRFRELLNAAAASARLDIGVSSGGIPVIECGEPEGLVAFADALQTLRKTMKPATSPASIERDDIKRRQMTLF